MNPEAVITTLAALPDLRGKKVISAEMAQQALDDLRSAPPPVGEQADEPKVQADLARGGWKQAGQQWRGRPG